MVVTFMNNNLSLAHFFVNGMSEIKITIKELNIFKIEQRSDGRLQTVE